MLARWLGIPIGFLAFLFVAYLFSRSFGPGLPFLAGAVAAWRIWWHCHQLDQERFEKILNPPAEIWAVSLPAAWGILKDVFDSSTVNLGRSGLTPWRLEKDDPTRGIMTARLNFDEVIGQERSVYKRTIVANATLVAAGVKTCVQLKYEVFSPMGTRLIENVIATTNQEFASRKAAFESAAHIA